MFWNPSSTQPYCLSHFPLRILTSSCHRVTKSLFKSNVLWLQVSWWKNLWSLGHITSFAALQLKPFRSSWPTKEKKMFYFIVIPKCSPSVCIFPIECPVASSNVFPITLKSRTALIERGQSIFLPAQGKTEFAIGSMSSWLDLQVISLHFSLTGDILY